VHGGAHSSKNNKQIMVELANKLWLDYLKEHRAIDILRAKAKAKKWKRKFKALRKAFPRDSGDGDGICDVCYLQDDRSEGVLQDEFHKSIDQLLWCDFCNRLVCFNCFLSGKTPPLPNDHLVEQLVCTVEQPVGCGKSACQQCEKQYFSHYIAYRNALTYLDEQCDECWDKEVHPKAVDP